MSPMPPPRHACGAGALAAPGRVRAEVLDWRRIAARHAALYAVLAEARA